MPSMKARYESSMSFCFFSLFFRGFLPFGPGRLCPHPSIRTLG